MAPSLSRGNLPLPLQASGQTQLPADPGALGVPFKPSLKQYHCFYFMDGPTETREIRCPDHGHIHGQYKTQSGVPWIGPLSLQWIPSIYDGP